MPGFRLGRQKNRYTTLEDTVKNLKAPVCYFNLERQKDAVRKIFIVMNEISSAENWSCNRPEEE